LDTFLKPVAGLVDSIIPAGEVVKQMVEEAEEILRKRLPRLLSSG
jgi:hypothetical protein